MIVKLNQRIEMFAESIPNSVLFSFAALGSLYITNRIIKKAANLLQNLPRSPLDFANRYGKGSWVIITEGADVKGSAWAYSFASRGFNILIVDQDTEKAESIKTSIELTYKVLVEISNLDISAESSVEQLMAFIEVNNLDVSVLVHNAGILKLAIFESMKLEEILNMINSNCSAPTRLVNALLPKLLARDKKSAIIRTNLSIGSSGWSSIFLSTQAYNRIFADCLNQEIKDKVDILVIRLGKVKWNMHQRPEGFVDSYAEDSVKSALNKLGRSLMTQDTLKNIWVKMNVTPESEGSAVKYIDT